MALPLLHNDKLRTHIINLLPPISHGLAALLPAVWLAALGDFQLSIEFMICAFLIGNLPDIDTTQSRIGRLAKPLSHYLYQHFGHRTITHSLLATSAIAAPAYLLATLGFAPWAWWWWPAWYVSHLLLDMIIGGRAGVTLLWPASIQFYIFDLPTGGLPERIVTFLLIIGVTWPALWGIPSPTQWLRNATGNLDYAITDYRNWETEYELYADIEGTWQDTRQAISGRYAIERLVSHTFHLRINDQTIEAGQSQQPIYLRRIVVQRGPRRMITDIAFPPAPTPTPAIVPIRIDNVSNPETEIMVKTGDRVEKGQLLADLAAYRQQIAVWPTPTPQPLPPTPTPAVNDLDISAANTRLQIAIAQATAAANAAHPNPEQLRAAEAELSIRARDLQQAQAAYDTVSWKTNIAMLSESLRLEQATNQYNIAAARATAATHIDYDAIEMANVRLQMAYVDYQQAIATPTPPYIPPTPLPTTSPPDNSIDVTRIYSLLAGTVRDVQIVSVVGNQATIEILIQTTSYPTADRAASNYLTPRPLDYPTSDQSTNDHPPTQPAKVLHVSDGDTFTVLLNGAEETIRLLDLDTPETVHPTKPVQCYGPEASAHTKKRLCGAESGETCVAGDIYLETAERDRYGRLLAYVWLDDGVLYNEELVALGFARFNDYGAAHQHTARMVAAQQSAQASNVGLWGACSVAMN